MSYPCVPFNAGWSDGKFDIRAIYTRPNGDVMTLPLRRHQQWTAKGFAYVTLADHDSLAAVKLANPQQYCVGLDGDGRQTPWIASIYLAEQKEKQAATDATTLALIEKHGIETVEEMRGPVPERLKAPKAKKDKAA